VDDASIGPRDARTNLERRMLEMRDRRVDVVVSLLHDKCHSRGGCRSTTDDVEGSKSRDSTTAKAAECIICGMERKDSPLQISTEARIQERHRRTVAELFSDEC
jgi:hypothetical protein